MGLNVHGNPINSCLRQIGHLGPRMTHPVSQLSIRYKGCFKISIKGATRDGFSEKILIQDNLVILAKKW